MSQVEQTHYYNQVHSNKLSPPLKPPTQNMPMPGGMNQSGPPPQAPHGHNMPSEGPPAPHMQNQMNGQMPGKTQSLGSVCCSMLFLDVLFYYSYGKHVSGHVRVSMCFICLRLLFLFC